MSSIGRRPTMIPLTNPTSAYNDAAVWERGWLVPCGRSIHTNEPEAGHRVRARGTSDHKGVAILVGFVADHGDSPPSITETPQVSTRAGRTSA